MENSGTQNGDASAPPPPVTFFLPLFKTLHSLNSEHHKTWANEGNDRGQEVMVAAQERLKGTKRVWVLIEAREVDC